MVTVRNRRNGVESLMTQEQWGKIQSNPLWDGVFSVVDAPEPPEVKALNEQKAKRVAASQRKEA